MKGKKHWIFIKNALKNMNNDKKNQLSLGALISYLAIAAKLVSGLLYTPIILDSLGQGEYGVYSLCVSFTGYLTIFNGGMNAAYVRYYVQSKTRKDYDLSTINGLFFKIFFILGMIGMFAGFVIASNVETIFGSKILQSEYDILRRSLNVIAVTILVNSINCLFSSAIIANEKFVICKLVDLMHTIIIPVITIPFLLNGSGSVIILKISLAISAVVLIFNSIYSINKLEMRFNFGKNEKKLFYSIMSFAGFVAIQSIMDQLNWQVDKLILAHTNGSNEVAVYSVGSTFNNYYITIASAISGLFIAEINRLSAFEKNKEISDLFVRTSILLTQIVVFIMSAYIIFGKQFILRWSGEEYGKSYYVGMLIMLPVTFSLSQGLGQDIARAKNLHKIQICINAAVCFCNFLVSIPLAAAFGAIGSAFGTFLCEIIICIIVRGIYFYKIVKIDMKAYYKEMFRLLPGWVVPIIFGIVINYLDLVKAQYFSIICFGIIYTAVYFISVWLFALSDNEKHMIKRTLKIIR